MKISRFIEKSDKRNFLIKVSILATMLFCFLWLTSCKEEYKSLVVTAQVAKTLVPESNTATVLIGRTTLYNLFLDQPSDTAFGNFFPVTVQPISGALIKVNEITLPERTSGIYFKPALDLEYMRRHDLYIATDEDTITGSCVLPDSFSITRPRDGDSVLFFDVRIVWTKSDSAEHYIIGVQPLDTLNGAQGWSNSLQDTFCIVPQEAFMDTADNFFPGGYLVSLMSFNGAWKKGSLDLFLSGGNLNGAPGIYGAAVYTKSLIVNIKSIVF